MNPLEFYKNSDYYEIACMLFEPCNLKCKFCFEDHKNKTIDTDYIENIYKIIDEKFSIDYEKYKHSLKTLYIMMWGGEIFYDALPDEVFKSYYKFVDNIKDLFDKKFPKVKVIFSWLSNGVFTNYKRVEDIVKYSKGIINFSYDPVNRFSTHKQKDLMIKTATYFKKIGLADKISITLTKDSIKGFIENDDSLKYFNDIGFLIDVNYYIANVNWQSLLATDDEIFTFFKWAIDNKLYRIKVLEKCFDSITGKPSSSYCNCLWCSQITHGQWSIDCAKCSSVLPPELFYGEYTPQITEENSNQIKASIGLVKRGCLACEYHHICQHPCWISIVFKGFKPSVCFYKQTYDYIKSNNVIINDFLKWKHNETK